MNRTGRLIAHTASLTLIGGAIMLSVHQRDPGRLPPGGPPGWVQVTCMPFTGREGDCYMPAPTRDSRQAPRCDQEPDQVTCHIPSAAPTRERT